MKSCNYVTKLFVTLQSRMGDFSNLPSQNIDFFCTKQIVDNNLLTPL